ncbi:hypothetical protein HD599_001173 [Conyzicola lurida]|uniref:Uncharacterized protein n=1 Tax=Conyzicola lurida TaxID=1172621 RepID=A0A841AGB0_9MICO|nr:hypothetical protein [Conyzicola lurida]MBB5842850.1 hypothetical protein [Conyzicola lurida]
MTSPTELERSIRFGLGTLTETNSHHDFETISLGLARKRIATNLMPATGPVAAGGDQGRDAESYWTNLTNEGAPSSLFVVGATDENVVLACTTQQADIPSKIRADLQSICSRGEPVDRVVYFTLTPVPVGKRHELQEHARANHSVALDIWDALAISRELAEHDLYYLAVDYLHLPAELAPERPVSLTSRPEWYENDLARWRAKALPASTLGELVDLRDGLRLASNDASLARDLPEWLRMAEALRENAATDEIAVRVQFEIAWATMRGTETLRPADEHVRAFFSLVPESLDDPGILRDATMLLDLGYAAMLRQVTGIPRAELETWHETLVDKIDSQLAEDPYPNTRALLLSLEAYLALHQKYPSDLLPQKGEVLSLPETAAAVRNRVRTGGLPSIAGIELVDVDKGMNALRTLVDALEDTPLFPVGDTADIFGLYTTKLADHPSYEHVRDGLDAAVERIEGEAARGNRALDRAFQFNSEGRLLDALHEIHTAKINWWHGDTLDGAINMLLLVAKIYYQLNLPLAAKQYALAASVVARGASDPALKHYVAEGFLIAATCDHHAGQSVTATHTFCLGVLAQRAYVENPMDSDSDSTLLNMLQDQCHILRAAHTVRPTLVPLLESILEPAGVMPSITAMLEAVSELPTSTENEIAEITDKSGMGRLFSDVGAHRNYSWSALGLTWSVRCANERVAVLTTERFIAAAQVVLADFARHDAHFIRGTLEIEIRADATNGQGGVNSVERSSGGVWRLHLTPAAGCDLDALHLETIGAVMHFLVTQSLLSQQDFSDLMETTFAGGLMHKSTIVRPYDELADFITTEQLQVMSARPELCIGWSSTPSLINPSPDLQPRKSLASTYKKNRAQILENIAYRYETIPSVIGPTLASLLQNAQFTSTARVLKSEGWLDWHLLIAIVNIVINRRAVSRGMALTRQMTDTQRQAFIDLAHTPALATDPVLPPEIFDEDELRFHLASAAASGVASIGLTIHAGSVPTDAILEFLGERYRYWNDDTPHDPLLDEPA